MHTIHIYVYYHYYSGAASASACNGKAPVPGSRKGSTGYDIPRSGFARPGRRKVGFGQRIGFGQRTVRLRPKGNPLYGGLAVGGTCA